MVSFIDIIFVNIVGLMIIVILFSRINYWDVFMFI